VASAVLLNHVPGDERAEAAGAAGDQHRPLRIERRRQAEHDLADVVALAQVAESLSGTAHVPAGDRCVAEGPLAEEGEHLGEHPPGPLGLRADDLEHVEGAVGDAGVRGLHLPRLADVGLAHLEEAAAARQQLERGIDVLASE
jgi:hypothetical protein